MSPRTYRLGRRAEAIDATRRAIVDATRQILINGGYRELSLDAVAARAGVVRATVYYHFRSKVGLLEAVAADAERRAGIGRFDRIAKASTAADTVRRVSRAHAQFWAAEEPVFRTLIGLSRIDPDIGEVVRRHDQGRRESIREVVERLRGEEALGPGWTVSLATEVLWLITSFDAFDHLHSRSGLSVAKTGDVLAGLASVVLKDRRDQGSAER